jgi:Cu/Ag efflux pump CusA
MKQFGMTANLMSLGALDFGLLVDASIVIMENISRRLRGVPAAERQGVLHDAALEVGRPVAFGVIIILAVYAPVTALEGIGRKMFIPWPSRSVQRSWFRSCWRSPTSPRQRTRGKGAGSGGPWLKPTGFCG